MSYRGEVVKTLTQDDLNSAEPLTIGSTTFTVTGYTEETFRDQHGSTEYKTIMTVAVSAPANSYTYSFTLTPRAEVSRTTTTQTTIGTATAPFYTITHNPAVYAATPSISSQPVGNNYRPGTATEDAEPLTAKAAVSDGGALTWQWYRATSATSTTGVTALTDDGASGSGGEASYSLPESVLRDVGMHYFYCVFTNNNPSVTSATKTRTARTSIVQINVSEGLVEVEEPIISGVEDNQFTFNWANYDNLTSNAVSLTVKKPAALKGAEPSWVSFPTPRQSEVKLELYVERWNTAKEDWETVPYVSYRDSVDYWICYHNKDGTTDGSLTCWDMGDYYYYFSETSLRSYLRSSYSRQGFDTDDPIRFRLEWTVTNELDMSGDSNFMYPTNLMGAKETSATHTVYIQRTPVTAPTFDPFTYQDDAGDDITADFKFEEGVSVSTSTEDSATNPSYDPGYPVITLAAYNSSSAERNLIIRPLWEGSRLAKIEARVEAWDADTKEWKTEIIKSDCTRDDTTATLIPLRWNSFNQPTAGTTTYCRVALRTVENNISSATTYSGVFAINWVEAEDAATPTAPTSLDTNSQTWHYRPTAEWTGPETSSLTLGQATELWVAPDNGTLTYQWSYSYYDADNKWTSGGNIAGATDSSLYLSNTAEPMLTILAAMKDKANNSYSYATFTLTVTNTNPLATGNRTATVKKSFRVYFKTALSMPEAKIAKPAQTTVATGGTIPLSLTFTNQAALDNENGELGYRWYYQIVSVTGVDALYEEVEYTKGLATDSSGQTTLETMPYGSLYYRTEIGDGYVNDTSLNPNWWAEHPDAQVKLKIYCTVTHSKTGYDTREMTTNPLEITLTAPTFNKGLKVETFNAEGNPVKDYGLDPTETVIVPKNGSVVFTMTDESALYGAPTWYKQKEGDAGYACLGNDGKLTRTLTYQELTDSEGGFQPCDVWAKVSSSANTMWEMETVKVHLLSNDVPTPQLTLTGKEYLNRGENTNFTAKVTNIDKLTGTVECAWSMRVKDTADWTPVTGTADATAGSYGLVLPVNSDPGTELEFRVVVTHTRGDESVTATETRTVTVRRLTINLPSLPDAVEGKGYEASPLTVSWVGEKDVTFAWTAPTGYTVTENATGSGYTLSSAAPTALTSAPLKVAAMLGETELLTATENLTIAVNKAPTGVTVSGTVTSFGSETEDVTIQLTESGKSEVACETAVKGNSASYSIAGVSAGTYTMKVMKKGHATREYTVTVADSPVTQDVKIHLLGDVSGDGKINTTDYGRVLRHTKGTTLLTGYEFLCGDVDSSGKLNTTDYGRILRHAKGLTLLW